MIVIESSAMVDALVGDPADPDLLAILADNELHAPSLIDYEVTSALRGHARDGKLGDERLDDAIDDFRALSIERYPLSAMIREVLDLKNDLTVYDAAYVVLAQALEAPLVTADVTLTEARQLGVDVRVSGRTGSTGTGQDGGWHDLLTPPTESPGVHNESFGFLRITVERPCPV